MPDPKNSKLHVAMFPWLATGHFIPYLHLANEFAKRGHRVSYLLPRKPKLLIESKNRYPELITFHVVSVPNVEGLPPGIENFSDAPSFVGNLLSLAFDAMRDQVEVLLRELKPDIVFYDFAFWIPELAPAIGFKSVNYQVICAACIALFGVPGTKIPKDRTLTEEELVELTAGYPSSTVVLPKHEMARQLTIMNTINDGANGMTFHDRVTTAKKASDAIALRTCKELEGPFCEYLSSQYKKPVLLSGPILPETDKTPLEDRWAEWLGRFEPGTVIYCAFGSQVILKKSQFQELLLGFELTGLPFLIALKPPEGTSSIEEALPEGFAQRVEGRGVVCGTWIQQTQILRHPSVGCFVSHCGFGSMWESLMSDCQIVLVPFLGDQMLNSRILCDELKVAVEVVRDENGFYSKESLSNAIKCAMDPGSELGSLIKENHARWNETLMKPEFMSNYVDSFIAQLFQL